MGEPITNQSDDHVYNSQKNTHVSMLHIRGQGRVLKHQNKTTKNTLKQLQQSTK